MTLPFRIKFSLGDWSNEGHGKCDHYYVRSSLPVTDLRELHFKCQDVFGFTPGHLCREYDCCVLSRAQYEKLKIAGIAPQPLIDEDDNDLYMNTELLLEVWLKMLQFVDPFVMFVIETDDDTETMHFNGFDEKGRHLDVPGYGCFE